MMFFSGIPMLLFLMVMVMDHLNKDHEHQRRSYKRAAFVKSVNWSVYMPINNHFLQMQKTKPSL